GARDEPEADALRRADLGARPGARRRRARRDAAARERGDDDGRRHARDGLRARGRRPRRDDGRRRDRRGGDARGVLRLAARGADEAVPREDPVGARIPAVPEPPPFARCPLLDALLPRRSRRFAPGMTLDGGPLTYASDRQPAPLTLDEQAALAFAACGITGHALAELPYADGAEPETGGGTIM